MRRGFLPGYIMSRDLNYEKEIKIVDGVYWVGFMDRESGLHCNPYLVVDGDEAVLIDGGSRPHFPIVMKKILQTGIQPSSIVALIYQHYDPDLCGSISNLEDIIDRPDLMIISNPENNMFIRHYSITSKLYATDYFHGGFKFKSGRSLRFFNTPYAHAAGSFVTLDEKTGVLFTSDLYGSYSAKWDLFLELTADCRRCRDFNRCPQGRSYCPLPDILRFHRMIMTSNAALRYALEEIAYIPFRMIAPQHGSVITRLEDICEVTRRLNALDRVGIDRIISNRPAGAPGDISPLTARIKSNESSE